ncbi:MAG: hypothetical protein QGH45_21090, partial [Myxococcota bacterium]|nr:hypothetical protein [Myxococcota bacterium]
FLVSAGRWPAVLILDGLIVATFVLSVARLTILPFPVVNQALIAGGMMVLWLTAGNMAAREAFVHKGLTLLATAFLGGVALMVQMRMDEFLVIGGPEALIPLVTVATALGLAVMFVVFRRHFTEFLYDPWEARGTLAATRSLLRGFVAVVLFPAWFPVLVCTWLLERIYGEMLLPDFGHRLTEGDLGSLVRGSRFSSFIGLRYMKGKRDQRFVSVITVLSILAVTMGVWTLTVVLSVMSGFELDLRDKILGTNAHAVVLNYTGTFPNYGQTLETVESIDGVVAATPFVYTELMVKHDDHVTGAIFKGVETATVGQVTDLVGSLKYGPDGLLPDDRAAK